MADLYRLLGLSRRADGATIKSTYYRLAKRFHPDVNAGVETERIREINQAYHTLGDPIARSAYDVVLRHQRVMARQRFRKAMAAGAATFLLTLSTAPFALHWLRPPAPSSSNVSEVARTALNEIAADLKTGEPRGSDAADLAWRMDDRQASKASSAADAEPDMRALSFSLSQSDADAEDEAKAMSSPASTRVLSAVHALPPMWPQRWALLQHARAGFELKYPTNLFAARPNATHADDRLLGSADGRALMRVYSERAAVAATPAAHRARLLAGRYAGAILDYAPQREHWFVLSGMLGEEMFYERVSFSCDRKSWHGWLLSYPVAERVFYDAIVEEIHRGYRYGRIGGRRCTEPGPGSARRQNSEPEPILPF